MTTNPFRTLGCTCSTVATARAALEGKPRPLCKVHHAGEIAQQAADRRQYEREAELGRLHEIYNTIKADLTARGQPECTCPPLRDTVRGHLEGRPPADCPVHDTRVSSEPSDVALNDDQALAAVIGLPTARNIHNTTPPDAA